MTENSPKRRWFQFRLRTLLIVVLVLSLPLSWLAVRIQKVREQKKAMELLVSKGWILYYADSWYVEGFSYPLCAAGRGPSVTDGDLKYVQELSDLENIELQRTNVTDAGLRYLGHLTELKGLALRCPRITDDGLKHLSRLTNLEYLYLDGTSVSNHGLNCLRHLSKLKQLSVVNTNVTHEGGNELQEALPNCKILY